MINIELTNNEALVFLDFLARLSEKENKELFQDKSEQKVLWNIECILEKQLVEPFSKEYDSFLKKARNSVKDTID